ncbi:MAG: hypothetical protein ACN6NT_02650, partial [Comamonas sp.]
CARRNGQKLSQTLDQPKNDRVQPAKSGVHSVSGKRASKQSVLQCSATASLAACLNTVLLLCASAPRSFNEFAFLI